MCPTVVRRWLLYYLSHFQFWISSRVSLSCVTLLIGNRICFCNAKYAECQLSHILCVFILFTSLFFILLLKCTRFNLTVTHLALTQLALTPNTIMNANYTYPPHIPKLSVFNNRARKSTIFKIAASRNIHNCTLH